MILLSSLSPQVNIIIAVSLLVLVLGLLLKKLNQPYIVAYILCGVILGPHVLAISKDADFAQNLGDIGIVILMFFIGMEISLPEFISRWRIAFFGTGMQVVFSVGAMALIGYFFGWTLNRIVLLGFITAISSSAVVIKLIENAGATKNRLDDSVVSILLTQDVIIVPMLITITLLSGNEIELHTLGLQLIGGVLIVAALLYLFKKKKIRLPFHTQLANDHELQIFGALLVCFGCALLSSMFELSASLGALVAGMFIHASNSSEWLHDSLQSFRVILVSFFFISVGMLINLKFMMENLFIISLVAIMVFAINQAINSASLRLLGNNWRFSIYGGALLAQIGEFSFILASVGFTEGIIGDFTYQLTVITIAISILISPFWVALAKKVVHLDLKELETAD